MKTGAVSLLNGGHVSHVPRVSAIQWSPGSPCGGWTRVTGPHLATCRVRGLTRACRHQTSCAACDQGGPSEAGRADHLKQQFGKKISRYYRMRSFLGFYRLRSESKNLLNRWNEMKPNRDEDSERAALGDFQNLLIIFQDYHVQLGRSINHEAE